MNEKKCDDLYCLIENTVINCLPLTLMGNQKQGALNEMHFYNVSFAIGTKKSIISFLVADDGKMVPTVEKDILRSLFGVGYTIQLEIAKHVYWSC